MPLTGRYYQTLKRDFDRLVAAYLICPFVLVIFYPLAAMTKNPLHPEPGNWLGELRWSIFKWTLIGSYGWWTFVGLPMCLILLRLHRRSAGNYIGSAMVLAAVTPMLIATVLSATTYGRLLIYNLGFINLIRDFLVFGFFGSIMVIPSTALFWFIMEQWRR